ncbi:MAG: hypothetical protein MJE63_33510, partial [Proteobacteria bacterium]|nr:hypothetical protein [Pseudomonadota bacterium]
MDRLRTKSGVTSLTSEQLNSDKSKIFLLQHSLKTDSPCILLSISEQQYDVSGTQLPGFKIGFLLSCKRIDGDSQAIQLQ